MSVTTTPGQGLRYFAILTVSMVAAYCCYLLGVRTAQARGVMTVRELRLVNELGGAGARLGFDENGHSSLEMYDEDGVVRLSLSVGGRVGPDLYLPTAIAVLDRKGGEVAKLRCYSDPNSAGDYGGVDIYHRGVPVVLLGRDLGTHSRISSLQLSDDSGRTAVRLLCGDDGLVSALELSAHPTAGAQLSPSPSAFVKLVARSQTEIASSGANLVLKVPAESTSALVEVGDGVNIELSKRSGEVWRATPK